MKTANITKIVAFVAAAVLAVFVFLQGKSDPNVLTNNEQALTTSRDEPAGAAAFDFTRYVELARESLTDSVLAAHPQLRDEPGQAPEALAEYAQVWSEAEYPAVAGFYYQQAAEANPTEERWLEAAEHFFKAQKVAPDTGSFRAFAARSTAAFERVLAINPENLDAKADLAVSYIEATPDDMGIMKGVGLLKEVEQANPDHPKALFYLGVLSIRSGQLEKALERFGHLVSLQPQNPFNFYYLGQVHLMQGNRAKALTAFGQYQSLVQDPALKQEAEKLIRELKQNNS